MDYVRRVSCYDYILVTSARKWIFKNNYPVYATLEKIAKQWGEMYFVERKNIFTFPVM